MEDILRVSGYTVTHSIFKRRIVFNLWQIKTFQLILLVISHFLLNSIRYMILKNNPDHIQLHI